MLPASISANKMGLIGTYDNRTDHGCANFKTGALNHSATLPRLQNQDVTDISSANVLATSAAGVAYRDSLRLFALRTFPPS